MYTVRIFQGSKSTVVPDKKRVESTASLPYLKIFNFNTFYQKAGTILTGQCKLSITEKPLNCCGKRE